MSLYNPNHPCSNGLEICLDGHSRDWPTLFALACERLQRIEMELRDAKNTHQSPSLTQSDRL